MTEYFDVYDAGLNHIGVKPRDAVHRAGDWHQVFHCWVVGRGADGEPFVLLQKRAAGKDYPGKIDISAAGHLQAGETVRDGLRVRYEDLVPLGRRLGMMKDGQLVDCQICHVFLYECDRALADYRYARDEITCLLRLRLDDGLRLLAGEVDCVPAAAVGARDCAMTIRAEDFIPSIDNYPLKALILARRYFAGERHLWI